MSPDCIFASAAGTLVCASCLGVTGRSGESTLKTRTGKIHSAIRVDLAKLPEGLPAHLLQSRESADLWAVSTDRGPRASPRRPGIQPRSALLGKP
jgi:hypothetical protein